MAKDKGITPKEEDYSAWYQDIVLRANLADYSPVKGCMIIMPDGYAIWENIQKTLDGMFKETGHRNAYFPLLIPESFLKKEAEHVEGFSPELAVVTHAGGEKLDEPLIVRPTSETIMYAMYSKWIRSYRDLPLLINQWCNIVRWEMRTRLFLRTTEFLWQEGHTVHASHEDAWEEVIRILDIYDRFAGEYMAIPVLKGIKTDSEKFAGALKTTCIEALMQDGKALQAGTSHDLGQNFAKAFEVKYQDDNGEWQYCWQTSWGVSTRLIGALIMAHSDNTGLILPPKIAPIKTVIVPIWRNEEQKGVVLDVCTRIKSDISKQITCHFDCRDTVSPGFKFNEWELKGIPVRIEIGPRDVEKGTCVIARRTGGLKETVRIEHLVEKLPLILDEIQKEIFNRALLFRDHNTFYVDSLKELSDKIDGGGFFYAFWCGNNECEAKVKEETKSTIRLVPFEPPKEAGRCLVCGKEAKCRVPFARSY